MDGVGIISYFFEIDLMFFYYNDFNLGIIIGLFDIFYVLKVYLSG